MARTDRDGYVIEALSPPELEPLTEEHRVHYSTIARPGGALCAKCGEIYPCPTIRLAQTIEEIRSNTR